MLSHFFHNKQILNWHQGQKVKLPTLVAAAAAGTKKKRVRNAVNPAVVNLDCVNPEQVPVEVPAATEGELVVSVFQQKKTLQGLFTVFLQQKGFPITYSK